MCINKRFVIKYTVKITLLNVILFLFNIISTLLYFQTIFIPIQAWSVPYSWMMIAEVMMCICVLMVVITVFLLFRDCYRLPDSPKSILPNYAGGNAHLTRVVVAPVANSSAENVIACVKGENPKTKPDISTNNPVPERKKVLLNVSIDFRF